MSRYPQKSRTKNKKATVYNNSSELYNEYLEIYFNQYMTLSDAEKRKVGDIYDPEELFLEGYGIIIVCGQKMQNNRMIKKNQLMYHQCHH